MQRARGTSQEITTRYRNGESVAALCKEYKISYQRVYQIVVQECAHETRSKLPVGVLSLRTAKALLNNHMAPVKMDEIDPEWVVRNFDAMDLRGIPNLGEKGRNEVIAWVESHGLKLREREIVWNRLRMQSAR